MKSLMDIIIREFKYIISNKRLLAILLIIPLFYTSLFGLLYSENVVLGIKTVVVDLDKTTMSRMVIEAFNKSNRYDLVASLQSEAEINEYIESEQADAAIVIPKNFCNNVYKGEESPILIIVNGCNMIISNSVTTSALQIIQTLSTGIAATKVETGGGVDLDQAVSQVNPLSFRIKTWYNPGYNYSYFLLLGLVATVLQQVTLLYVAVSMAREIERGTLPELREMKGGAIIKVMGKTVPYFLCSFLSFSASFLIARYVFAVPFHGSIAAWFLLTAVFLFCIISLGIFLSIVCRSELEATQIAMLVAVPSFLFSGFTWPIQAMPLPCKYLAWVLPLTYFAPALRKLAIMGLGVEGIQYELHGLLVMTLILVPLSVLLFKWKYEKGRRLRDLIFRKKEDVVS
jgi:ABC-2 type transport system permease protein